MGYNSAGVGTRGYVGTWDAWVRGTRGYVGRVGTVMPCPPYATLPWQTRCRRRWPRR